MSERARERTRVQHLAQHLEQQSQPGIATQQAQEAAAQPEVVALNNRVELRRSEEQFSRIAFHLNCLHMTQSGVHRQYEGLCKLCKSGGVQRGRSPP